MTVETIFLSSGLRFIREALLTETPINITRFHIGSAAAFAPDTNADDVLNTVAYVGLSPQVATAVDDDDNIVYTITLGEDVGTFSLGNLMIFASNPQGDGSDVAPLIHVILPTATPKNATVGLDLGNTIAIRVTINLADGTATTALTLNYYNESLGVLPSVATEGVLPAPGPSAFQHYMVQQVTSSNAPAIAMRRTADNTWWGNGFVQRLDDYRFGWAWGGTMGDTYGVLQTSTIWGGFFETGGGDYNNTIDGGDAWLVSSGTLDGGTW